MFGCQEGRLCFQNVQQLKVFSQSHFRLVVAEQDEAVVRLVRLHPAEHRRALLRGRGHPGNLRHRFVHHYCLGLFPDISMFEEINDASFSFLKIKTSGLAFSIQTELALFSKSKGCPENKILALWWANFNERICTALLLTGHLFGSCKSYHGALNRYLELDI